MLKSKVLRNASWIIICKIAQAILSFLVGVLTTRYLGPSNYGLINYAASLVAFVVPVMQLGLSNILVQELLEKPEEEGKILGTSLLLSVCSSFACMITVALFTAIANKGETDTLIICILYSFVLVFQAFELLQYWFQAKFLSKYTSLVMLAAYFVTSVYRIILLITGKSVYWFALANAVDYIFIAISLVMIYKKIGNGKFGFSKEIAVRLFAKSKYYIISGIMINVFAQTDKIMLKFILDEAATGLYSAAVNCAGLTGFVFAAMIDSGRPSVFEGKKKSTHEGEKILIKLYSVIIYLSLAQCIGMTLFSKFIILFIYGEAYSQAISALQIIVWYTTFSYMGAVRDIWILMEGKQKYIWIINLSGALANVALNACFIPIWGINGAALASLLTQVFTNVVIGYIIKPIRQNNRLMVAGMHPRHFISLGKQLINR